MKYIVADVGSRSVRTAVLDLTAARVAALDKTPAPERRPDPNPEIFEVPARLYAESIRNRVDEYSRKFPDAIGVIVCTQMHGFVYSVPGREDMYVSWQDLRCLEKGVDGISYIKRLARLVPPADMAEAGVHVKPSLALCNLYAMLESDLSIPRDGTLYTLGSYITGFLTGGANVCHITSAASLGLANAARRKWNRPLLEKLGLERIRLPEIAPEDFQPCGTYGEGEMGLPVYPDFGDQQISVLGCMPESGDAIIDLGASGQVMVLCDGFVHGPFETRPYFGNRFIREIGNMPAGRGLAVFINLFRDIASGVAGREVGAGEIWNVVLRDFVLNPNRIEVDSAFYPVTDHLEGGSVRHMGPDNLTLSSLFSATFMDMARVYWENIQVIAPADEVERLICSGGVAWNTPPLLRAIAWVTGRECRLSPARDGTLEGLFRVALVCGEICDKPDDKPELRLNTTIAN